MKLNILLQANVPHGARLCVGAGAAAALLRAPGHRAGRGEQVQVHRQGVDCGGQGGAPAQAEVSSSKTERGTFCRNSIPIFSPQFNSQDLIIPN